MKYLLLGMGDRQALYANLEAGATSIREYQQTFLPGLLQVPETVVAIDTVTSDLILTEPAHVTPYDQLRTRLRDAALPQPDGLTLLTKAAATLPDA